MHGWRDYRPVDFDLIVVGGGPVGSTLALATRELSVALVAHEEPSAGEDAGLDARVYALSPGNVAFLQGLGVWQRMAPERLQPVRGMRIFGDSDSQIGFDAYRAGVSELAWIVEDRVLQQALWRALRSCAELEIYVPGRCAELNVSVERAALLLDDGRQLAGRLVAGADGAGSFVRERSGVPVADRDYGQSALVANFACERPHDATAFQWFQRGPVLALLPLPRQHVSMVWSLPTALAQSLIGLGPEELCSAVEEASHAALGRLSLATTPRSYPLRRLSARRMVAPRVALVGDAAHVIHPLAGQGLNLGLQDVRGLASVLEAREAVRDPGDLRLLRRYERSRAEPVASMEGMVDGLFRLFGAQNATAARLRNAGLNLTERLPVLKNLLMRRAMG
jgi:2-polyprenylphenol 6-hydroxylase